MDKREIKFRAWNKEINKMVDLQAITPFALDPTLPYTGLFIPFDEKFELMQFTGLKDRNGAREIYEGDIIDSDGVVIGNYYENSALLENTTNFLVKGLCTKDWADAEAEALKRGCQYAQ